MNGNITKSGLGIALSKLKGFGRAKVRVEQYSTGPEIAAEVLWNLKMLGDSGKVIADFGAGTGILGIGAMILGAPKVYFVENDKDAVKILKDNITNVQSEGLVEGELVVNEKGIKDFNEKTDVVIMNPPFGTKVRHADREFLIKAFETANTVYSFHKSATERFVKSLSEDCGFRITHKWDYAFRLKKSMRHHKKAVEKIDVSCYRLERG